MRMMPMGSRQRPSERHWAPAADVYRTKDGWLVKLDLAGVAPDEIELTVEGRVLVVEGCRRDSFCEETVAYHQLEITYSRFEKTLRFPCTIDRAHLRRDYRDGFLLIYLHSSGDCEGGDQ